MGKKLSARSPQDLNFYRENNIAVHIKLREVLYYQNGVLSEERIESPNLVSEIVGYISDNSNTHIIIEDKWRINFMG